MMRPEDDPCFREDYLAEEEMLRQRLEELEDLPEEKHFNPRESLNIKHKRPKWVKR